MTHFRWAAAIAALTASNLACADPPGPNVRFVDASNLNPVDGATWSTAYNDLQTAIDEIAAPGDGVDTLWVAAGTYIPGTTNTAHFKVPHGITILGGFQPGDDDTEDRDWISNQTILSGENVCDHVVYTPDESDTETDPLRRIDGVYIQGGDSSSASPDQSVVLPPTYGAGLLSDGDGLVLVNSTIRDNLAGGESESPLQFNIGSGGGAYIHIDTATSSPASPTGLTEGAYIANCQFVNNGAANHIDTSFDVGGGGARAVISAPAENYSGKIEFINCVIAQNGTFTTQVPQIDPARGAGLSLTSSSPGVTRIEVINCTIAENGAIGVSAEPDIGGGIYVWNQLAQGPSPVRIENCIIWGNESEDQYLCEQQIMLAGSASAIVEYNDIEGGIEGDCTTFAASNISLDPQFINGAGGDFRISDTSPAIDAGNIAALGVDRYDLDDDDDITERPPAIGYVTGELTSSRVRGSVECKVDMGAYEYPATCTGDFTLDGEIGFQDLLDLLAHWTPSGGACSGSDCDYDIAGGPNGTPDGIVGFADLVKLLADWGPCGCPDPASAPQSIADCIQRYGFDNPTNLAACIEAMMHAGTP